MPRVSRNRKQLYRFRVRSMLSADDTILQHEIGRGLEVEASHLDWSSIGKLVEGIAGEWT
jgi:hypothetical protein